MAEYPNFDDIIKKMPQYLHELESCQVIRMDTRQERSSLGSKLPVANAGIYVLYEDEKPMYAGRSDRLKERILEHGQPGNQRETATFAFILAREAFGDASESVSRKDLQKDPDFERLFLDAKKRVSKMVIRAVGIKDPIEQTLFEVYAHLTLGTPRKYNSFDNH